MDAHTTVHVHMHAIIGVHGHCRVAAAVTRYRTDLVVALLPGSIPAH